MLLQTPSDLIGGVPMFTHDSPSSFSAKSEESPLDLGELPDDSDDLLRGGKKGKRPPSTAEKRATHNAVERARRESLNGRFMELAGILPNMQNVKRPSKSAIINKSLDYVQISVAREQALLAENEALRQELQELRARLNIPSPKESAAPTLSATAALIRPRELSIASSASSNESTSPQMALESPASAPMSGSPQQSLPAQLQAPMVQMATQFMPETVTHLTEFNMAQSTDVASALQRSMLTSNLSVPASTTPFGFHALEPGYSMLAMALHHGCGPASPAGMSQQYAGTSVPFSNSMDVGSWSSFNASMPAIPVGGTSNWLFA